MARNDLSTKKAEMDSWDALSKASTPDKRYLLGEGPAPEDEPEEDEPPRKRGRPPKEAPKQAAPATSTGDPAIGLALHEFIHDTLPQLDEEQLFELVCAIPQSAWVKEELYEGEDAQNTTMEGQVKRMLTAVRAMYNDVYINGRIKVGKDVAEAQKVFNACASAFKTITNFEQEVYTLARQQAVERATVKILRDQFPRMADAFMAALEAELGKLR